jgi:hypothetical protein
MRALKLTKETAQDADEFRALFLEGQVRFGDLRAGRYIPWPLSARLCAAQGARRKKGKMVHPGHSVQDLLLAGIQGSRIPEKCSDAVASGQCGAKLTAGKGYYERDEGKVSEARVQSRINAHTAISSYTLRIRPEQFFSTEVVERRQVFRGSLTANGGAETALRKYVPAAGAALAVGRGATRGQGHAAVKLFEASGRGTSLRDRLLGLNRALNRADVVAFTCTFRSPCIAYDEFLMSRSKLTSRDLEEAAGILPGELAGYEVHSWFSRLTTISGWNSQAQLPRPDVRAIEAGSAFLFVRSVKPEERDEEVERIAGMLSGVDGIGERWEEGYGEAVFCDPFHYEQAVKS